MRSLSPGTTFRLTQGPLDVLDPLDTLNDLNDPDPRFLTTRAVHAGINNLPKHISAQVVGKRGSGSFKSRSGRACRARRAGPE